MLVIFILLLWSLTLINGRQVQASTPEFVIADNGRALTSVVIRPGASDRVKRAAFDLATYLSRMSGATIEMETGDGSRGIVVGVVGDFDAMPVRPTFDASDPRRQEEYLLQTTASGLYVIGASETGVENAVWDLLYRLGYRQFFPGINWEIVPRLERITLTIHDQQAPDYLTRWLWTGHGTWHDNGLDFSNWLIRNRARQGLDINHAHNYQNIVVHYAEVFKKHPEYLGLVGGRRYTTKLCISNPGLRQLVVDYAMDYFKKNPESISISMEPSDGGGWCECEPCAELGTPSDRMILLCNQVAQAINATYDNKYVGTLAYYQHAIPPKYKVHPMVAVNITTGLRVGGMTTEDLIEAWRNQGVQTMGLSYNVGAPWALRDVPLVATEFKQWNDRGINRVVIDIWDQWGQNGLGSYLLSRVLWDVQEGNRTEALLDDFFNKSFGRAAEPMRDYFDLIYRLNEKGYIWPVMEGTLARMYQALGRSLEMETDPAMRARIHDLVIYTRVIELEYLYSKAETQAQREILSTKRMRFIYRTRESQMVHSRRMFGWPRFHNLSGYSALPVHALPESKSPWKSNFPVSDQELSSIVEQGRSNYQIQTESITPVAFSTDLVPAKQALNLPDRTNPYLGRGDHYHGRKFYTWIDDSGQITMIVQGGRADGGMVTVSLYTDQEAILGAVDSDSNTGPGQQREIVLKSPHRGLHYVQIESGGVGSRVRLPDPTQPRTYDVSIGTPMWGFPAWSMFFYVPKGTQYVGGFAEHGSGMILDSIGRVLFKNGVLMNLKGEPVNPPEGNHSKWDGGYFNVPVPEGEDGKIWQMGGRGQLISRRWFLITVPPYMAETVDRLMLPREVVERDAPAH